MAGPADAAMVEPWTLEIAGSSFTLHEPVKVLAELAAIYAELERRSQAYRSDPLNPHLCHAGCSACCRSGAFFAVSIVEAVQLALAVERLPAEVAIAVRADAERYHATQARLFATVPGPPDRPGRRDEESFSARVTKVARSGPSCPLLAGDLCGVYDDRPLLCRAYGFPVDAWAVRSGDALVLRSLCSLYESIELRDYVRAEDLKTAVAELSTKLAGGKNVGRFTSAEAILACIRREESHRVGDSR